MGVKAARPTLRLLMSVATLATTVTESAGSLGKKPKKSPDRDALMLFGQALQFQGWHENSGWGSGDSVCKWHGITCNDHTRVTGIDLGENGLDGFIHPAIGEVTWLSPSTHPSRSLGWSREALHAHCPLGCRSGNLTELKTLNVKGGRPAGYYGCNDSNVHYTGIPDTFYNLVKLTDIDAEYMCLGGPISPLIGNLVNLVSIQIHGNFLNGTIPLEFNKLTELQVFKLGRNPLSGPFPNLSQCKKLVKFSESIQTKMQGCSQHDVSPGFLMEWLLTWRPILFARLQFLLPYGCDPGHFRQLPGP